MSAGAWDAGREVDAVSLDYDGRFRRRILLTTENRREVMLDLPQAVRLRHGDGLLLDDGGVVRVAARPEALLDIHAHNDGDLVRIAWHLGNRHLPVQVLGEHIRIRADHVIEEMIFLLGGHVEHVEAAFDPEAGAYAGGHSHHHGEDDGPGHSHG